MLGELYRDKFMLVVAIVAVLLAAYALLGPALLNQSQLSVPSQRLFAPVWAGGEGGFMGTDQQGRALSGRIAMGLQTTFLVGFAAVAVGLLVGVTLGLVAGYWGGWADTVIMRAADIQMSLPALLISMTFVATLGGTVPVLIFVLGLNSWMIYARLIRGEVLRYKSNDFVMATESLGAGKVRTVFLHLLPNIFPTILSLSSLELARVMLAEATLSFVGFGVQPPGVSLGLILGQGREYITSHWWIAMMAGLALALLVLVANLLGDWAKRKTDPIGNG